MRIADYVRTGVICTLAAGALGVTVPSSHALDQSVIGTPDEKRSPWAVFRFGFSAYQSGKKEKAVEAYRYAAENGQVGARWKLARMYAEGDGVPQDDYEAFKFFSAVAQQEVSPGSRDESYVSDALVAIASYLKSGIPGTPVKANPALAQEYYMRAAAAYRNATAQYELGRMLLTGEGGTKSVQQAAR